MVLFGTSASCPITHWSPAWHCTVSLRQLVGTFIQQRGRTKRMSIWDMSLPALNFLLSHTSTLWSLTKPAEAPGTQQLSENAPVKLTPKLGFKSTGLQVAYASDEQHVHRSIRLHVRMWLPTEMGAPAQAWVRLQDWLLPQLGGHLYEFQHQCCQWDPNTIQSHSPHYQQSMYFVDSVHQSIGQCRECKYTWHDDPCHH